MGDGVGVGVGDGVGVGVGDGDWVGTRGVEVGVGVGDGDWVGTVDEVVFFSINKSTDIVITEAASSPIIILDLLSMTSSPP